MSLSVMNIKEVTGTWEAGGDLVHHRLKFEFGLCLSAMLFDL